MKHLIIYFGLFFSLVNFIACSWHGDNESKEIIKLSDLSVLKDLNAFKKDSLNKKNKPKEYLKKLITFKYNTILQQKNNDSSYIKEIDSLLKIYPNKSISSINNFFKAKLVSETSKVNASEILLNSLNQFEKNRDTTALISTYYELYFYNGSSSGILIGNEKLKKYYSDKIIKLGNATKDPLNKVIYYFFCIIQKVDNPDINDESDVLSCYKEANNLIDKNPTLEFYKEYIATVTTSWYFKFGRFDEIKKIFNYSLKKPVKNVTHTPLYCLSVVAYYEKDYKKSLKLMKIADSIYQKIGVKSLEVDSQFENHYVNLYLKLNVNKDSLISRMIMRDSLTNLYNEINRKNTILELQSKYQDEKKEEELKRKSQDYTYLSVFTIMALLSLVVITILFYFNKKNKDKLAAELQMKEDIQRVISHDMLSPLIALEGMVNRSINYFKDDNYNNQNEEFLSNLRVQQNYLQTAKLLCQNIVNWLWTDNQIKAEKKHVNFTENIEQTVQSLASFTKLNNCTIEVCSAIQENDQCFLDFNAFNVVFRNLLTNVMRHSKSTKILINLSSYLNQKEIRIYDNGEPMDYEFKQELENYFNNSTNEQYGGLGSYLIKTFLTKIKGKYRWENSDNINYANLQIIILR